MPVWKKVCVYFVVMHNVLPYTFFAQIYKFDISINYKKYEYFVLRTYYIYMHTLNIQISGEYDVPRKGFTLYLCYHIINLFLYDRIKWFVY